MLLLTFLLMLGLDLQNNFLSWFWYPKIYLRWFSLCLIYLNVWPFNCLTSQFKKIGGRRAYLVMLRDFIDSMLRGPNESPWIEPTLVLCKKSTLPSMIYILCTLYPVWSVSSVICTLFASYPVSSVPLSIFLFSAPSVTLFPPF